MARRRVSVEGGVDAEELDLDGEGLGPSETLASFADESRLASGGLLASLTGERLPAADGAFGVRLDVVELLVDGGE